MRAGRVRSWGRGGVRGVEGGVRGVAMAQVKDDGLSATRRRRFLLLFLPLLYTSSWWGTSVIRDDSYRYTLLVNNDHHVKPFYSAQ